MPQISSDIVFLMVFIISSNLRDSLHGREFLLICFVLFCILLLFLLFGHTCQYSGLTPVSELVDLVDHMGC